MDKDFEPEEDEEMSFGWDDEESIEIEDIWLDKWFKLQTNDSVV